MFVSVLKISKPAPFIVCVYRTTKHYLRNDDVTRSQTHQPKQSKPRMLVADGNIRRRELEMRQIRVLLATPLLLLFALQGIQGQSGDVQVKFATPCLTPNSEDAYCVEIQHCPLFLQQLVKNNNETFDFLRQSRCGPVNEDPTKPKVCCGTSVHFESQGSTTVRTTTAKSPTAPPRLNNPLPKQCGKQAVSLPNRIVGGIQAKLGEFPWLARLRHKNQFNYTGIGCAGLLIHRRYVLTAAHCVSTKLTQALGPLYGVFLGVHNDTEGETCVIEEGKRICSDRPIFVETGVPIIHGNYDPNSHMHDIALLPLKTKVNFTEFIKAVCIPFTGTSVSEFWLSGWGRTETDNESIEKLKVSVPRVTNEECSKVYRRVRMEIRDTQLCAGGVTGKDSCSGDSGGPLMALETDGLWYAEGIVSYGSGCGRQGWPGVYTHVPKYFNWIVDNIRISKRQLAY